MLELTILYIPLLFLQEELPFGFLFVKFFHVLFSWVGDEDFRELAYFFSPFFGFWWRMDQKDSVFFILEMDDDDD